MKISVRCLVFALIVSLATPCPAQSLLRFARPAGAADGEDDSVSSVKFRVASRPAATAPKAAVPKAAAPASQHEAKRQPRVAPPAKLDIAEAKRIANAVPSPPSSGERDRVRGSASARVSSSVTLREAEPRKHPAAARIAATPISTSGGPTARLNATSRRSLFELVLRQKPDDQYGAKDIVEGDLDAIELPRNPVPSATATDEAQDEALPPNEIPSRPLDGLRSLMPPAGDPATTVDSPPSNTLPGNAAPSAEDGGEDESSEPRWLPLEQGEVTAPLPPRDVPRDDEGEAAAPEHEAQPEDYALAPLPGPPLPAVHGRVGWEPIYPGDPWANYGHEATAEAHGHGGGLLGWLLSLLRVFHH